MRLSNITDEELQRLAVERLKRTRNAATLPIMEAQLLLVSIFQELLDRRREDALRMRSAPAIKLAIAQVELLRDNAIANGRTASVTCLDFQLELLKEYDTP